MNRRQFLTAASAVPLAAQQTARPPNVLFVLVDQWRFSALSHSTDPVVQTPHSDRCASQGGAEPRAKVLYMDEEARIAREGAGA